MKPIIFFVTIIFAILQLGCKQNPAEVIVPDAKVNIEVESDFQNDLVQLAVDNNILLNSNITTNYVLSLAWSSGFQKLSKTTHILHFAVVEYGIEKDYKIDMTNEISTVLIRFDKSSKQISISQIEGKYIRD